jgi:hypothetical protein
LNGERPDGEAYEACISILLSLRDSKFQIDREEKIKNITRAITIYNAWHVSENDIHHAVTRGEKLKRASKSEI